MNLSLSADFKPTQFGVSNEPKMSPQTYVHNRGTKSQRPAKLPEVSYLETIQRDTHKLADKLAESDNAEAFFTGLQLAESVADDNLFVGFGLVGSDGDTFTGRGNLVGTSSRLDRFYLQRSAKNARKQIAKYLGGIELRSRERWRFVTLTMPRLRGCSFDLAMRVIDGGFKFLRDDKFWREKVRAGVKSREFTLGKEWEREERAWTLDEDGFHVHFHFILASKWMENRKINEKTGKPYKRDLAEHWGKALRKSAKKNGVQLDFNADDGLPIVDIRLVVGRDGVNNENEISLKKAIEETAKYITKQDVLIDLPVDQIIEISAFLKGKRMIEPLGEANKRRGFGERKGVVSDEVSDVQQVKGWSDAVIEPGDTSIFQKQTIEKCVGYKAQAIALINKGEKEAAARLVHSVFEKRRAFRRKNLAFLYPTAEFMLLTGETWSQDDYEWRDFREKLRE